MIPVVDKLVRDKIKETVIISNSSQLWDIWSDPPIPIYLQFYMFNLTNSIEVKEGKKPAVYQVGPYTYRERRIKFDIVFNENGTVSYRQNRTFTFVREMSVGDPSVDLITTANPPVLSVINSLQYSPAGIKTLVNDALRFYQEDIFMTRTVKEVMWGYVDPSLKTLMGIYPSWFYTDYVGYFINKNDTDDGVYTIFTGAADITRLGEIDVYNGSRSLTYWSSPWANLINGSDGTLSPPFQQDSTQMPMFSSDICRSVFGVYQKTVSTKQDIQLRRFVGSAKELENASANPDNIGFCTPQTKCLPSGLLNISNCQIVDYFHIPVVVSFPHFYLADPSIQSSVYGLHPVPEEHQTAVDVEPWTGLVLQAYKRLQINMYITKIEGISLTADVPSVFLPVFWLNESAVIDDKHAAMLHQQLFAPMEITSILEKVLMTVGCFIILLSVAIFFRKANKSKNDADNIAPDPVPTLPTNPARQKHFLRRTNGKGGERTRLVTDSQVGPYDPHTPSTPAQPRPDDGRHASINSHDPNDPVYHEPINESDS